MPIKKLKLESTVFISSGDPNSANVAIFPANIGDLCVDVTNKKLYFAFAMTATSWGTSSA
jgi:hypothetical protein